MINPETAVLMALAAAAAALFIVFWWLAPVQGLQPMKRPETGVTALVDAEDKS